MFAGVKESLLTSSMVLLSFTLGLNVVHISNQPKPLEGFL